jgi:hypothetical protein
VHRTHGFVYIRHKWILNILNFSVLHNEFDWGPRVFFQRPIAGSSAVVALCFELKLAHGATLQGIRPSGPLHICRRSRTLYRSCEPRATGSPRRQSTSPWQQDSTQEETYHASACLMSAFHRNA